MRMLPSRIRLLTHNPPIAGANMILDQCTECIIGVDVADPVFLVEIIDGIRPSEIEGKPAHQLCQHPLRALYQAGYGSC